MAGYRVGLHEAYVRPAAMGGGAPAHVRGISLRAASRARGRPYAAFRFSAGIVFTIHGTPNRSTRLP